jgi:hypothetical protein
MLASTLAQRIAALCRLSVDLARLPVAHLHFRSPLSPEHIRHVYSYFTKPHPKYKIFKNKSLGAALIDLRGFETGAHFIDSLRTWGRAGAERRRALARGHHLCTIDRNQLVEEIHQINISSPVRQGIPMASAYLEKQSAYQDLPHFRYYGVFDRERRLVAYCNLGFLGNFAVIDRLLGLRTTSGAMYLLLTEIVGNLIDEKKLDYLMYDTLFGARPGLRDFKRRLGFQPYRVRYSIE